MTEFPAGSYDAWKLATPRDADTEADELAQAHELHRLACYNLDRLLDGLSRWKDEAVEAGDSPDKALRWLRVAAKPGQASRHATALSMALGAVLEALEGICEAGARHGRPEMAEPEDGEA